MNGNNDQRNQNMRRPAGTPGASGQRTHVRRPEGQGPRPQGQRPPLRPQQRRGEAGAQQQRSRQAPPVRQPSSQEERGVGRNVILALILLVLVIILFVIFGVQACLHKEPYEEYHGNDDVILNTTSPPKKGDSSPCYADYTDSSGTLSIDSGYGILIDLDTNTVIASRGGEERIYPASMTKVMTLIVAFENVKDLDSTTYTFDAAMLDELFQAGASVAGFSVGETVTVRDLLYGAILPSGGDATNALADLVAGGEEHFSVLMNEKVKELGLENTNFVTASGLHDDNHYSTCHDIAKILEYAISNPEMRKILSTYRYTTSPTPQHPDGITLTSTMYSRMEGTEVDGLYVQGGKTGYTLEGRNCLCSFAANCREDESLTAPPQYILVTAYAIGEYTPVYDAFKVYEKYCTD
ncbi:MAG: hypothetical protein E7647_04380 [Ruminococcaceae bacterium]|nr:hypothetical protein [Oscillospiraceae bacterium]